MSARVRSGRGCSSVAREARAERTRSGEPAAVSTLTSFATGAFRSMTVIVSPCLTRLRYALRFAFNSATPALAMTTT